ncbi:MAG: AsmA-like C-terminal domain-containing protein, partial [Alphaproteobacteria bacterium]|nr:AsmA-like C-terminal domain-containing protein [Alphaproteobacteria bacterium]
LRLDGRMPGPGAIEISGAELDLGGPVIGVRAGVSGLDAQPRATATVTARNVTADDMRRLWPPGLARNARTWITQNIVHATIGEARADMSASAAAADAHWTVDDVKGTFTASGVEANYLTPMPHVEGVNGEGTFTKSRVDITTNGGGVGNLRLGTAVIALTKLDTDDETADLDVPIDGPVREALELVDGPPLGYVKKIDRKPSDFSGDMTLRLVLKLPLKHDLDTDQIDALATAHVQNLTQADAALGQNVTDGDVQLRVDKTAMTLAGRVKFGPLPADVELTRNFTSGAPVIGRTRATARVANPADYTALGLSADTYIDGPTTVAVDYVERQRGHSDVTIDLTLDDAAVSIDQLDWHKPAGRPTAAHFVMNLAGGHPVDLSIASINSGDPAADGLLARARATFAPDGKTFNRVDIETLRAGRTDIKGFVSLSPAGVSLSLSGPSLDLGPFIKTDTTPSGANRPGLDIDVRVDRLYFEPDRWLRRVSFLGRRGPERWLTADLQADTSDDPNAKSHAALALQMFEDGHQTLDMVADDAGAFFRNGGVTPNVVGGRLTIHGATDVARPGHPIVGQVNMTAYRVVGAPILARVLSVALLTGLVDSLSGNGIGFSQLDADFAYYGPRLEFTKARSAGPAIGVTANGSIDIEGDTIDLSGTIVPANALNSLPSKIPLIGNLLTGGGGGLFAATYKVSGPLGDPKVSVNPLSTLAPGFLRNLFRGLGGTSATDATPESEKQIEREQPKDAPPAKQP